MSNKLSKVVIALSLAATLVMPVAHAQTTSITDLQAQIAALQAQLAALSGSTTTSYTFTRNLTVGSRGADVTALQQILITGGYLNITTPTGYFGPLTKAAVAKWQAAVGLPATGFFGPLSRAKVAATVVVTVPPTTVPPTTVPPTTTGGVSAMLATDSPAAGNVINNQATAELARFTFNGNGTVTSVTLRRMGISDQNTLTNVYLYDGNTRLTDGYAFNTNSQIVMNNLAIAVNGAKTISVRADVSSTASNTASTIQVGLVGFTANGVAQTSNIWGNVMSIVVGNPATASLSANTVTGTPTVNAGTSAYTFWSAPLQVNVRQVWLRGVNFRMVGSAPADALANVRLYVDGTAVGSAATVGMITGSNYLMFDLSSAPVALNTGSHTVEVRADIVKGSSRTVQLSLQQAADLVIYDAQLGVNIAVSGTIPNNAASISINAGTATVVVDPSFQVLTTATGGTANAVIGRFRATAYGEDIKVSSVSVTPTLTGCTPTCNGLNNVTLYFNGSQVGSSQNWTTGALTFNLGSQMIIPAGTTGTIEVRADLQTAANANYTAGTVGANLNVGSSNAQGQSSSTTLNFPTATVTGTTLTITTANLVVAVNTAVASQNASPNTTGVKVGSFTLQNQSSSESVRVTSLVVALTCNGTNALSSATCTGLNANNVLTNYANLRISEVATPVQPQATNTFSVNFTLAPGQSRVIDVFADTGAATSGTIVTTLTVTSVGVTSNISTTSSAVTGQTITISTGTVATPTLVVAASTPAQYLAAAGGCTDCSVATYNFVSTGGASTISELKFAVTGTATNPVTAVKVGNVSVQPVNGVAYLTGLSLQVPNGGSGLTLPVYVSYANVGTGGVTPATTATVGLSYVKYTSGGTTTTLQFSTTPDGVVYFDADASGTVTAGDVRRTAQVSVSSGYAQTNTGVVTFDATATDTADENRSYGTVTSGQTIILTETGAATNVIGAITGTLVSTGGFTCTARDAANGGGSATTTIASIQSVLCTNTTTTSQVVLNVDPLGGNGAAEETTITLTTTTFAIGTTVAAADSDLNATLTANGGGIAAPTMTLVGSKPTLAVNTSVNSGLNLAGENKIGEVTITADAKGNIKLNDISFAVNSVGFTTVPTFTNARLADGTTTIPGTSCGQATAAQVSQTIFCEFITTGDTAATGTTAANTESNTDFDGYTLAAGTSKTFSLYATVSAANTGTNLAQISTSLNQAAFNWDDTSTNGASGTNLTGTLIYNFPTGSYTIRQ